MILVVNDEEAQEAYLKAIDGLGMEVDTVSSFEDLYQALTRKCYNGVLIDLVTKMKTPRKYLDKLLGVMEQFPMVQLRWDKKSDVVKALYAGTSDGNELEDFIKSECIPFKPRMIRASVRRKVYLNVLFSLADLDRDSKIGEFIRTVTVDISAGGCFLITTETFKVGREIAMKIMELSDQAPIIAEVRWRRIWGQSTQIPGVGVMFTKISDSQKNELLSLK